MTALADLTAGASVRGLLASGFATVESVQWIGEQAVKVMFRDGNERQIRLRPIDRPRALSRWQWPNMDALSSW